MIIIVRCCECGNEIKGDPYAFSGNFACEECVRNYYKGMHDSYSDDYIESELISRRFEASKLLKRKV